MVQPWWAAGLAIPVVIGKGLLGGRNKQKKVESSREREDDGGEPMFACERVCTSDRLQRKLGGLSKDPYPNTCVTVCGVSATDACTEACQRTVCVNAHQVPAWNDSCLKRCTTECLRGRSS